MTAALRAYRARVVEAHRAEFDLHVKVATALEEATARPRAHSTIVHLVIDMLMRQSLKAHVSVMLLAQHGFMEDSATIARRLLELAVQAVYIGAESDDRERARRAGKYVAFMWRQLPRRVKQRFQNSVREYWSAMARSYGRFVPAKAKTWGPNWKQMFTEIGHVSLYESDYAFLSSIAHGRSEHQILAFSEGTIRVHSHEFTSILLRYSSKYYLVVTQQWNVLFHALDDGLLTCLIEEVN